MTSRRVFFFCLSVLINVYFFGTCWTRVFRIFNKSIKLKARRRQQESIDRIDQGKTPDELISGHEESKEQQKFSTILLIMSIKREFMRGNVMSIETVVNRSTRLI